MNVIIPMTGYGTRFKKAGYKDFKPFIKVNGIPIIDYVCSMYPKDTYFIFIVRRKTLENEQYRSILMNHENYSIVIIDDSVHLKQGPVYDILQIKDLINDDEEVIVNYCDFFCLWRYEDFLKEVRGKQYAGAIPVYTGFHPHLLIDKNVYASCKVNYSGDLIEIKEKYSFDSDKTKALHSPGIYWFSNGWIMKKCFQDLVDSGETLNGEFYASLPYNYLIKVGYNVAVPKVVDYFCQWGTPEDFEEFTKWIKVLGRKNMNILIPMAGAGSRFKDEGYETPKPLIPTFDRKTKQDQPMIISAVNCLPEVSDSNLIFVDRTFHKEQGIEDTISKTWPNSQFITLDRLTEGQACSCLKAQDLIDNDSELLIGACDCGIDIDESKFNDLKNKCDCIVFTFKNNDSVCIKPDAYGWMITDEQNNITGVSIKKAISDHPEKDNAVTAVFWFKRGHDFVQAALKMIEKNDRINNEFYVDQVIKYIIDSGLSAKVFVVDKYFCWGTPKDYEDYQNTVHYWERFLTTYKSLYNKEF